MRAAQRALKCDTLGKAQIPDILLSSRATDPVSVCDLGQVAPPESQLPPRELKG